MTSASREERQERSAVRPALQVDRTLDAKLPTHSPHHVIAFHHAGRETPDANVEAARQVGSAAASAGAAASSPPAFADVVAEHLERVGEARRPARRRLAQEVSRLRGRLRELLEADAELDPDAHSEEALARSAGAPALAQLDLSALARQLPSARGPLRLSQRRREHVASLAERLGAAQGELSAPPIRALIAADTPAPAATSAPCLVLGEELHATARAQAQAALEDALAIARDLRAARLELAHAYEPALHEAVLAGMCWEDLGADERVAMPVIVVVDRHARVAPRLPELLDAPAPLHVVCLLEPGPELDAAVTRPPPANLVLAHDRGLWLQTSVSHPEHLHEALSRMAAASGPAIAVVLAGEDGEQLSLAVESRTFPLVLVDPEAEALADRLQLSQNPQPDQPVANRAIACTDASGRVQMIDVGVTWADMAAHEPALRGSLRPIASSEWAADQLPLADFVEAWERGELAGQVPFVWVANADGALQRAIVDRALSRRARAVQRGYAALRQLFGPDSAWARSAAQQERAEAESEAEQARRALIAEHERALEQVRRDAGSNALRRLAEALLSLDPLAPAVAPAADSAAPSPTPTGDAGADNGSPESQADVLETSPATPEPAAATAPDDLELPSQAYVESELCTTCDDCTQKFPHLFAYNDNKQAELVMDDPPFAQLVAAAELCPARCIHTGAPRADDDTVTPALVERAQPFL